MLRIYLGCKDVLFWDMLWHMLKTLRDMLRILSRYAVFGYVLGYAGVAPRYPSNILQICLRYAQISVGYAVLMEPGEE